MKRSLSLFVLSLVAFMIVSTVTVSHAFAANETIVITPPAAPSPIPIPYPNISTSQPQSLSGFKGFIRAAAVTNGIVDVVSID